LLLFFFFPFLYISHTRSGTFGMEAVARQFAEAQHVMVIRNGWFSYRWTEILELGRICRSHTVLKAEPVVIEGQQQCQQQYRPVPVERVVAKIMEERPAVLFCPHVETSTGMILPDSYLRQVATAVHAVDGLLVLDCIASGTVWVDMVDTGVDVLISAPQKGWTGPPCAALVMLSSRAVDRLNASSESSSFSLSLKRWCAIMEAYEKGGFAYHTTMPTDALRDFHEISVETLALGLPFLKEAQWRLGNAARALLDQPPYRLTSVAAPGYQAPGVLVYYSPNPDTPNPAMMAAFKTNGLQIAMGVPWKIDEPANLKTFRIGLFGLDKLTNIHGTLATLDRALAQVMDEVAPHHQSQQPSQSQQHAPPAVVAA
jgi:alanine-glyoxylate transaminase / serine-glyoxylate transaminase / serine-pyruvate transaminase